MDEGAFAINFPAYDGPVLRMGAGNVSVCQSPPCLSSGAELAVPMRFSWLQDYTS